MHGFEGLLRRVAALEREDLVLRGGVLLRAWVGPERPAEDLDLLATWPFEAGRARRALREVCAAPCADGLEFELGVSYVTWDNTPHPGLRAEVTGWLAGESFPLQVDLGCGDPMDPPPTWTTLPGLTPELAPRALSCRPETLVGWKLHSLYERGIGTWRAKDLHDLSLLLERCELARGDLVRAIRLAHESRAGELELLEWLRDGHFGQSRRSRRKWRRLRGSRHRGTVPETVGEVVTQVAPLLQDLWAELAE